MTTEEKTKAYDKAIRKAEALYKASEPMSACNVIIETIFPELKESEDERIRKAIISGMKSLQEKGKYTEFAHIPMNDVFAWLEKQGKEISWKPSDEQIQTLEYYMHNLICNKHKEILFGLYNDLKKLKEK